jgi:hypothetical protein
MCCQNGGDEHESIGPRVAKRELLSHHRNRDHDYQIERRHLAREAFARHPDHKHHCDVIRDRKCSLYRHCAQRTLATTLVQIPILVPQARPRCRNAPLVTGRRCDPADRST